MRTSRQLINDLRTVFYSFPLESLQHLRANRHRLVRRTYRTEDGRGCVMYLLSERLPQEQRIDSKGALMRYFSNGDPDAPEYQPAKWIVRLWDRDICSQVQERYGPKPELDVETLMRVLDEVIAERSAAEVRTERPETVLSSRTAQPTGAAV